MPDTERKLAVAVTAPQPLLAVDNELVPTLVGDDGGAKKCARNLPRCCARCLPRGSPRTWQRDQLYGRAHHEQITPRRNIGGKSNIR